MEYLIRDCKETDLTALVKLCRKHAAYEKASYNPQGKQELLKEALFSNSPDLFCLIVESNNEVVGYASYTYDFSTWDAAKFLYLDCLYLECDFRGYGIGEVIINKLKDIAAIKGCVNVQWQTPDFNERAIKFYNRIGAMGKDKVRFFLNT
jgi:L-amino acid N-acyltransferase YncA